ncbi:MAG TPA: NosD domain-containing protein [Myxococcaceae bacterium]|jgi:hypothetical protein
MNAPSKAARLALMASLLLTPLTGCDSSAGRPLEEPLPLPSTPPVDPDPSTPGEPTGQLTVSLQGLGEGYSLTAMRLRPNTPAEEAALAVPAGATELMLTYKPEESLSVTVNAPDGTVERLVFGANADKGHSASGRILHVPVGYSTIQAAINAASAGDTVLVRPGTYSEHVRLKRGVRLQGVQARETVLKASEVGKPIVDLTEAPGSMVTGFTFQGAAAPQDLPMCSRLNGDECYCVRGSAVYADGHDWFYPPLGGHYSDGFGGGGTLPSVSPPALVTQNIFKDNYIGVGLYFHPLVHVRNNIFLRNRGGVVAKCFQDRTLIANNVFYENQDAGILSEAGYLDIINNIIVRSPEAISWDFIQTGLVRCNLFSENGSEGTRVTIGQDGNLLGDPRFVSPGQGDFRLAPGSPAKDTGCFQGTAYDVDGSPQDRGIHGGSWGRWMDP